MSDPFPAASSIPACLAIFQTACRLTQPTYLATALAFGLASSAAMICVRLFYWKHFERHFGRRSAAEYRKRCAASRLQEENMIELDGAQRSGSRSFQ
jgi:hypothetical protein